MNNKTIKLRKFPYPYRACLSICSDIDYTDTRQKFERIQAFMNKEVGINFTNTFFPFHDQGDFSLFSGSVEDKTAILKYIKDGVIDAIHSYGERKCFSRQDALKVLEELKRNNCCLKIWIDHAESPSNFCKYRFPGKGDLTAEKEYHADLTKDYGIKFIWTERLTNIIGQDTSLSLAALWQIYNRNEPVKSFVQLSKTLIKIILSFCGNVKYDFYKSNTLVRIATLADKQKVYEFIRYNNSFQEPRNAKRSSFSELYRIINDRMLSYLKKVCGYSIVYAHLGKDFDLNSEDGKKSAAALYSLKKESDEGNIYVASTTKILNYYITHKYLKWSCKKDNQGYNIYIDAVNDPISGSYMPSLEQLEGITFYIPDDSSVHIYNKNEEFKNIKYNPRDFSGQTSLTLTYEKIN